mgnify:CR=1 FL=1
MYLRRLKDLRIDNDLYQKQVADYLKITRQQYGLYEIGKRDIPIDFLCKLADFYKVSTDYILGRTNKKDNSKFIMN